MFAWIGKNERGVINRKFGTAGVCTGRHLNLSSSWVKGVNKPQAFRANKNITFN